MRYGFLFAGVHSRTMSDEPAAVTKMRELVNTGLDAQEKWEIAQWITPRITSKATDSYVQMWLALKEMGEGRKTHSETFQAIMLATAPLIGHAFTTVPGFEPTNGLDLGNELERFVSRLDLEGLGND